MLVYFIFFLLFLHFAFSHRKKKSKKREREKKKKNSVLRLREKKLSFFPRKVQGCPRPSSKKKRRNVDENKRHCAVEPGNFSLAIRSYNYIQRLRIIYLSLLSRERHENRSVNNSLQSYTLRRTLSLSRTPRVVEIG